MNGEETMSGDGQVHAAQTASHEPTASVTVEPAAVIHETSGTHDPKESVACPSHAVATAESIAPADPLEVTPSDEARRRPILNPNVDESSATRAVGSIGSEVETEAVAVAAAAAAQNLLPVFTWRTRWTDRTAAETRVAGRWAGKGN